jgi:hypothetical protein
MTERQPESKPQLWQFATPKLWIPGVTRGRKPKLNWNRQVSDEDIVTQRRNEIPEDFFDQ